MLVSYSIRFNGFFDDCKPLTLFLIKHTLPFVIVLARSDIIRLGNNNKKIMFKIKVKIR